MRYYLFRNWRINKIGSNAAKEKDKQETEAKAKPAPIGKPLTATPGDTGQGRLIGVSKRLEERRKLAPTRERLRFSSGLFGRPSHSILLAFWLGGQFI